MFHNKIIPALAAAALLCLTGHAAGQEAGPPRTAQASPTAAETSKARLRVQLVITRFEGDRKLGSLPYTFVITPNSMNRTVIRMGVDTPIPAAAPPDGAKDSTALQYRNVGTNIDCFNVKELPGGLYQFDLNVQHTAALPGADAAEARARPLFRRFESTFTAALRDGQGMQNIASTDPVTGEVIRIDVTLNVVR